MPDGLVYLDHAAGTMVLPEITAKHRELCERYFVNPHGTSRQSGVCHRAVLKAQQDLLSLLGIVEGEADVIWTSGGTEACNLACLGFLRQNKVGAVAVSSTAHHAMLDPCRHFGESEGGQVVELPVCGDGSFDLEAVGDIILPETGLVAVCHVNNETGVVHDLRRLRRWMRQAVPGAKLAVDAMQSVGKMTIPWREGAVDLLVVGGRKVGGPAGVGALICRRGVDLQPVLWGGGQQQGLRPGTLDVVGIMEFVEAVRIGVSNQERNLEYVRALNEELRQQLQDDSRFNCRMVSQEWGSPYILSVSFPGYEGAVLMRAMAEKDVVVATGSACTAESAEISHVMKGMGVSEEVARGVLRISFSPATGRSDVVRFLDVLAATLQDY